MENKMKGLAAMILVTLLFSSCAFFKSNKETYYPHNQQLDTFIYHPTILISFGHGKIVKPTAYKILLPKPNINYVSGNSEHIFLFKDKQKMFIYFDEQKQNIPKDSLLLNPEKELLRQNVILHNYTYIRDYFGFRGFKYKKNRKHVIYYKDNATIILYNISKKDLSYFMQSLRSFEILPNSNIGTDKKQ